MSWEYEALFNRQDPEDGQLDIWSNQPTSIKVGHMGYRTRTTKAGDRLEAEVFPIFGRNEMGSVRAAKKNLTRDAQQRSNDKRAKRYLVLLIENNFGEGDYHMTITYAEEPTEERAGKDIKNLFNRLRRIRKNRGLPPLKYIYAMGGGEEDDEKRIHFHVILNGGLDRDEIEREWLRTPGAGRADADRLQPNEQGLEEVSKYLFKQHKDRDRETGGRITRRWNGSRNLKKPKTTTSDSRCSNARVKRIAHDMPNEAKAEMEKVYPGYRLIDCEVRYSDIIDGVYIRCVMRRDKGGKRA